MKLLRQIFLSDKVILAAVVLNAVAITWMLFPDFKNHAQVPYKYHDFVIGFDQFFIGFFLIEMLVKIEALTFKRYIINKWNQFDCFLVIISLPSILLHVFPSWFSFLPEFSLLLILRMFRLLRLIRFLRFIPNMNHILKGIGRAAKASVFVFIALLFMNFMLGLLCCQLFATLSPEHFGDPFKSMYSIFQMFTIEGWYEIPNSLEGKIPFGWWGNSAMRLFFVMVVLLGGVLGMSLVNAIFVDEMTMDNNDDLEAKIDRLQSQITELKDILLQQQDTAPQSVERDGLDE